MQKQNYINFTYNLMYFVKPLLPYDAVLLLWNRFLKLDILESTKSVNCLQWINQSKSV